MLSKLMLPSVINPEYWRRILAEFKTVFALLRDERVPLYLKAFPFAVGLYLVSPLDLIPGFLPVVGQLDDFALLLLGLKLFTRLVPDEIVGDYLPETVSS